MKAKAYLQQLRRLDMMINQKMQEKEDLRLRSQSTGSLEVKEKVQTSPAGDAPYAKLIDRIADLEAEIDRDIDEFVNKKHEIINQIQGLDKTDYIKLLFKRYVEFKKFDTIAAEMEFTYQYTLNVHGQALKNFESCYKML